MKSLFMIAAIILALMTGLAGCIVPVTQTQQPEPALAVVPQADINLTIGSPTGETIRPLLGVNIGPIPAGTDPANADLTAAYKDIGVNLIRTHDYYGPLDMCAMYPDLAADPLLAQSYDFSRSDQVWRSIVSGGFEPYLRLGDSYNNSRPPADSTERANWVKAGLEVIRHYRTGRWSGFNTPFRYVEIWNEPDNAQFWPRPHTPIEYFQLYSDTALAIKSQFPDLKVGGPGVTPAGALTPQGRKWVQDFLTFVRQSGAPLDFLSWHMYSNSPQQYAEAAAFYRSALDARGFTGTVKHITEWNTEIKRSQESSSDSLALRTGAKGAAILSACWIELQQQNDLEVSTFYRGPDPDIKAPTFYGLFYADGRPKSIASAFSLWSRMAGYAQRLDTQMPQSSPLYVMAGRNGAGQTALLIANPGSETITPLINFSDGRQIKQLSLYRVSGSDQRVQTVSPADAVMEIGAESVQLLVID